MKAPPVKESIAGTCIADELLRSVRNCEVAHWVEAPGLHMRFFLHNHSAGMTLVGIGDNCVDGFKPWRQEYYVKPAHVERAQHYLAPAVTRISARWGMELHRRTRVAKVYALADPLQRCEPFSIWVTKMERKLGDSDMDKMTVELADQWFELITKWIKHHPALVMVALLLK